MNEFSLHILDIAQNSAKALSTCVVIEIIENHENNTFSFSIRDNGSGMSTKQLNYVKARMNSHNRPTNSKHGIGLWLLRKYCIGCGGHINLDSSPGEGTRVSGALHLDSLNRLPIGDMEATLRLLRYMHPAIKFEYSHSIVI